jgi:hypothetical protein
MADAVLLWEKNIVSWLINRADTSERGINESVNEREMRQIVPSTADQVVASNIFALPTQPILFAE